MFTYANFTAAHNCGVKLRLLIRMVDKVTRLRVQIGECCTGRQLTLLEGASDLEELYDAPGKRKETNNEEEKLWN